MKLRLITLIVIATNILLLAQDIPNNIIALSISGLVFSLFITHKKIRNAIKILILIVSVIMLRLEFKIFLTTECGVSFALLLSALKFWELDDERDHFNMFLILALCECCIFLLNPTFLVFSFGLLKMLFYFYYILKIRNYDISLLNPKRLLILVTPSLIFSLILFYTFPRFTSGFINSTEMQYIISGGGSKFDFKQLGPLTLSNEQAFKIYGIGNKLPVNLLYWRSSVFWSQNGQEWAASNSNLRQDNPIVPNAKFRYDIEVFQQFKEYLPVLDGNSSIVYANQNFNSYSDGSFKLKTISRASLNYTVTGNYGDRLKSNYPLMNKKGLRLKSERSEEIKKFYFKDARNSSSDEDRLRELVQIFKNRNYEYSLSPPAYASIEDFLLSGKLGYCTHFASAFTYLARLYNLPARMVNGYLGGELNPYDDSVIVRELDAHAWTEVFIQSKGWVKVDPTVLVAPARAEMSADEFIKKLNPYITIFNLKIDRSLFSFSSLNNISLWLDSLNSRFNANIFNFDRDKQLAFLRSFVSNPSALGWIFSFSLCLGLFIFWLIFHFYGQEAVSKDEKRYRRFLNKMKNHGIEKELSETVSHFEKRCLHYFPDKSDYVKAEVAHYIASFYK